MTLRARLVAGLVVLMTAGLAIFGGTMYELYSRSQYNQLNSQLQSSVTVVSPVLALKAHVSLSGGPGSQVTRSQLPPGAGVGGRPPQPGSGPGRGRPPVVVAPGTFGELLNAKHVVLSYIYEDKSSAQPRVPPGSLAKTGATTSERVGSVSGSSGWLAYVGPVLAGGDRLVVAVPTSQVTASLHHLVLIEVSGAVGLLVILSAGAGLVLRRGLAPLERMAGTAREIAGGDLDRRVDEPPQSSEVGQLASAFNTMLDEIQAAFAQRDATEDRLRRFLADASHELRTPLTSIQGFAELSRLGSDSPHVSTGTIMRRIESEAARMRGLVEDLLLLARVDQVRQGERAPVDLSVLAADACSDAVAAAPARPVTLSAPQPVVVLGDEAHLRQALANLVANAVRHTAEGSPIEVSARLEGGQALLEVRDHGDGLDEQALAHAFDRFWQKDPARAGAGAGLGLAIVAAVAAEHDGQVVAANAPGGGAVFFLRLPLEPPGPRVVPGRTSPPAGGAAPAP